MMMTRMGYCFNGSSSSVQRILCCMNEGRKLGLGWESWRGKTTSTQYVEQRARDPTFEKYMEKHKKLIKVVKVQTILLGRRDKTLSLHYLSRLQYRLRLRVGAATFLRKYPHIFHVYKRPARGGTWFRPTHTAIDLVNAEDKAIKDSEPLVIERLKKLLMISPTGALPLKAFLKAYRELGLPDDFEDSILKKNPQFFRWTKDPDGDNDMVELVSREPGLAVAAVDKWRNAEYPREKLESEREVRFGFKLQFPPGFKIKRGFREKMKTWQKLPYWSPYEDVSTFKPRSIGGFKRLEKRAVGILHEFLSLTVEKMVEVEQISHFRKPFNIKLNVRDLFLDHPGIFYLSTKGKVHTVFLREAYHRGNLIEPNPVYVIRRKLLDLVVLGRHGMDLQSQKLDGRRAPSSDEASGIEEKVEEESNQSESWETCSDSSDDEEGEQWDHESDGSDWSDVN